MTLSDFQNLFYALPDKYLLLDPSGTVLDLNDSHAASSLSGRSRAEVAGLDFFTVWPPSSDTEGEVVRGSLARVRATRQPDTMPLIRYDLPSPQAPGGYEQRYWEATHYPVTGPDGRLRFILQRTEDVTGRLLAEQARTAAEQQVRQAQERNRFILESAPLMLWTANADGTRDYFNPRWLQFTGRALDAELRDGWQENIHPDDRARVRGLWEQAITARQPYQAEYRLHRHDGHYRWVLMRATPRFGQDGQVRLWVGGGADVHEQRQLVAELQESAEKQAEQVENQYQAYQQARSQRELLYQLFMELPAIVCILSGPDYRYTFVNRSCQQTTPGRELLHRPLAEALPETREQSLLEALNQVRRSGETLHQREVRIDLAPNDHSPLETRYFNSSYQLFREPDGEDSILVFGYDVTNLVQARQALEQRVGAVPPIV